MKRESIYAIPNPFSTLEQYHMFTHQDLAHLARPALLRERERVRLLLLLDDAPDSWLFQRLDAVRRALGNAR